MKRKIHKNGTEDLKSIGKYFLELSKNLRGTESAPPLLRVLKKVSRGSPVEQARQRPSSLANLRALGPKSLKFWSNMLENQGVIRVCVFPPLRLLYFRRSTARPGAFTSLMEGVNDSRIPGEATASAKGKQRPAIALGRAPSECESLVGSSSVGMQALVHFSRSLIWLWLF